MSSVEASIVNPDSKNATNEAIGQGQPARSAQHKNYKGFVAGVFSGISKLSGKISLMFLEEETLLIMSFSWASVRVLEDFIKIVSMGLM